MAVTGTGWRASNRCPGAIGLLVLVALALGAAGCGEDDAGSDPSGAPAVEAVEAPEPEPADPSGPGERSGGDREHEQPAASGRDGNATRVADVQRELERAYERAGVPEADRDSAEPPREQLRELERAEQAYSARDEQGSGPDWGEQAHGGGSENQG